MRTSTTDTLAALLRMVLGGQLLLAGIDKFSGWSAESYLASANGPFASFYQSLAGSPWVDALNIVGLTAVGVALILGFMSRPAAIAGMALMVLYYFAHFVDNTAHGAIDQHVVYFVILMFVAAGGATRYALGNVLLARLRKTTPLGRFFLT